MQRSVARLPDFLFALKRSFVRCCLRFLQQLGCVFPVLCYNKRRQLESEFDGLYRPSCPSEGVGRPKGGLEVVPTRNFTDLLVQLQIRNNPQSAWLTCGSGDGRVAQ